MECPTCRYPVPAEWSMCRRCGAPVHSPRAKRAADRPGRPCNDRTRRRIACRAADAARSPARPRRSPPLAAAARDTVPPRARAAARRRRRRLPARRQPACPPRPPSGAAPCAPRSTRAGPRSADRRSRTGAASLVLVVVAVALTMSVVAVWPVLFRPTRRAPTRPCAATQERSRPACCAPSSAAGARCGRRTTRSPASRPRRSSAYSYPCPIVAADHDRARRARCRCGSNSANVLTLATPADAERCVFARDEPTEARNAFRDRAHAPSCRAERRAGDGLDVAMKRVSRMCGNDVRPLWPTCRSCGALLMAPPAPVGRSGTAPRRDRTVGRRAVLRPRGPATARAASPRRESPSTRRARGRGRSAAAGTGKWIVLVAMVVFCRRGGRDRVVHVRRAASETAQTPVVLAPGAPTAGLPTEPRRRSSASGRVDAPAPRCRPSSRSAAAIPPRSPAMQTELPWVAGDQPSTDPHTVSVAQNAGDVTIAVAASNHDVCAFGQWSPAARHARST